MLKITHGYSYKLDCLLPMRFVVKCSQGRIEVPVKNNNPELCILDHIYGISMPKINTERIICTLCPFLVLKTYIACC